VDEQQLKKSKVGISMGYTPYLPSGYQAFWCEQKGSRWNWPIAKGLFQTHRVSVFHRQSDMACRLHQWTNEIG
jgi:hypothetical protein